MDIKRYFYRWTNLNTGGSDVSSALFACRDDFLECVNWWNRQGRGTWQYEALSQPSEPLASELQEKLRLDYDGPVLRGFPELGASFQL